VWRGHVPTSDDGSARAVHVKEAGDAVDDRAMTAVRRLLLFVAVFAAALGAVPAASAPPPGNPDGNYPIPAEAQPVDTSNPDRVIGNGTPQSCTSAAVVAAVAQGGIITFDCGPNPVTIVMTQTAKVFNDTGPEIVIDGGGLITLSGGGERRILYMNTCDQALVWTTNHCQNQDHPRLTVQNLTFVAGDATGATEGLEGGGGGGAIFVRGGRFKVINSLFSGNRCEPTGPDHGGAGLRVFSQHDGLPVYVVNSTFEGGVCSNGGGISSIGVSWTIINSVFRDNQAIGWGANQAQGGTPGGGNGGAIYLDGNTFTLRLLGTKIENNHANEGGGAVFFVSNNGTGTLVIEDSELRYNPSDGFETQGYPGIFVQGAGTPQVVNSVISNQQDVPDVCPQGRDCDRVLFQDAGGRFHRWHTVSAPHATSSFFFGNPGDVAFAGDWNCDGVDTPGLYRRSDGYVYLRNSNTEGVADIRFFFGNPDDLPLAGDFDGDECDTVSIFRPSESRVYVMNELGSDDGGLGAADFSFVFGDPGDKPFAGDFDGDGIDTIGLHRESTGLVYFRNTLSTGIADSQFIYGDPGDVIAAGDWNGDGIDTVAAYRPSNQTLYLKLTNSQGPADVSIATGEYTGLAAAR
jgi:hypothetical protein